MYTSVPEPNLQVKSMFYQGGAIRGHQIGAGISLGGNALNDMPNLFDNQKPLGASTTKSSRSRNGRGPLGSI